MFNLKFKLGHIIPGLVAVSLPILTGVTVGSNGISVSDSDVSSVMTPITDWAGSFFNVLIKFAPVFVVIFFVYLIYNFIKKKSD